MTTPDFAARIDAVTARMAAAREQLAEAEAARKELLVELVGDADSVPMTLVRALGLSGREAASIVRVATGRAVAVQRDDLI